MYRQYFSNTNKVPIRVPWGWVLGPSLFTICINDIPYSLSSGKIICFAEDTVLLHGEIARMRSLRIVTKG